MSFPPFDSSALWYDQEFEQLPGVTRLRQIVQLLALRFFRSGDHVLEVNCGTGSDAVALARHGIHVLSTDASSAMVAQAREKIRRLDLGGFVNAMTLPFEGLCTLGATRFDGIFSNLGGLNCAADLRSVGRDMAALLRPESYLVACFLSDFSLWETVAFYLRGNPSAAFRRLSGNPVTVILRDIPVEVYFHSPRSIEDILFPYFQRVLTYGLNIFTPPPSSINAFRKLGRGRIILERVDDLVARVPPFSRMGDHFVIVFRRTSK